MAIETAATRSWLGCSPRWATERTRPRTRGLEVANFARELGTPLFPWQAQVADVALELDARGKLAYRQVVLTVPRQSGKTTLLLAVMVHRALAFGNRQKIVYTAQDRNHARQKWEDEHVQAIQRSRFAELMRPRLRLGNEAILWNNGSMHGIDAPTESAVHGDVLDLGVIDEAFKRPDDSVEQGMKPAMITRQSPQLWIVSTAGNSRSVYLRGKVEAGRSAVEAGIHSGIAYFEWSAPPELDPGAVETWLGCMPGLEANGGIIDIDAIRADYQTMEIDEFRRAYLNQWRQDAEDEWDVISRGVWRSLISPYRPENLKQPAFAVDVTPDRTWGAIGAVGRRLDGMLQLDVVQHDRGTDWIVPELKRLKDKYKPCALVIAPSGPAGRLIQEAEAMNLVVEQPSARDIAHGCATLYDATGANPKVEAKPWVRHNDQAALNSALGGAEKREYGDIWLWDRRGLQVDISPLVAVTLALWGYQEKHYAKTITPWALSEGDDEEGGASWDDDDLD